MNSRSVPLFNINENSYQNQVQSQVTENQRGGQILHKWDEELQGKMKTQKNHRDTARGEGGKERAKCSKSGEVYFSRNAWVLFGEI